MERFATSMRPKPCSRLERHAAAEVFERRAHPALSIGCVGEAAERASLRLGESLSAAPAEAALVLLPASFDIAQREEYVSPQMVKAGEFAEPSRDARPGFAPRSRSANASSRPSLTRSPSASPILARHKASSSGDAAIASR